jgi:glycosyltransferase involved in cell wall biosynthesis
MLGAVDPARPLVSPAAESAVDGSPPGRRSRRHGLQKTGPVRLALLIGTPVPAKIALYRRLAAQAALDFTVIYASAEGLRAFDGGYGAVQWDADLTTGYRARFLRRADMNPGLGGRTWSVRDADVVGEIVRGGFDVLALGGYNSLTYLLGAAAQRAQGRPLLFREEQTLLEPRPLTTTLVKEVALRLLFAQGSALYISRENRRWFEHYGVAPDRLFPTPYTVDNAELQAAARRLTPERDRLRRSFGIDSAAGPVILSVGRLVAKKQPLFLLDAFRRVRERMPCTLLVVGSGEAEAQLRERVARDRIPDVKLAGFVNRSRIAEAYVAADVFALLSRAHETFGLAVPEAMNFRLPIVVSEKVGCAPDLVADGLNGFVVSPTDPAAAAAALARLAADAPLRRAMGDASLRRLETWGLDETVAGFLLATAAAVGPDRWSLAQP